MLNQASVGEFAHQLRRGLPLNKQIGSHHWVDGLNELQVRKREQLSSAELAGQLKTAGPKAVKGRWGTPAPMRLTPLPFGPPIGWRAASSRVEPDPDAARRTPWDGRDWQPGTWYQIDGI